MSDETAALGEQLKEARQRKGLSAQKAADAMHLDAWVVDALESGDYARIGPAVYAKGHLKRYAQLLGVPAADLLEAYGSAIVVPPTPAVQPTGRLRMPSMPGRDDRTQWWIRASGIIATAAVLAALLWWRPWAARSPRVPAAGSPAVASSSARAASSAPAAFALPNSSSLPSNRSGHPAVET
ncbi:MAG: helix-turn-helix domain-containing protein, partial [Pseudomonadota bacterium]|nr:helix-turn-helix domain-containing protein [Pseudomonadota bacterium]